MIYKKILNKVPRLLGDLQMNEQMNERMNE